MNTNVWTKTTLSSYPYLIKIADAIDRIVERKALNSFYVSSSNFASSNVYDVANNIIDLTQRKVVLINLKILVEDCLKKCDRLNAKILIAKYISKKKNKEIGELLGLSLRTLYRRLKLAERQYEFSLRELGYDSYRLKDFLKDEEWILDIKGQYEKGQEETITLNHRLLKSVGY